MTDNLAYRRPLRAVVVGALLTAAAAHIPVIPEHLHEAPYMGVAFIAFTAAATALAGVIACGGGRRADLMATALCVAAITAYALTRLVAFPELGDDVGNWTETLGLVSIAAEAVVVVASVVAGTLDDVRDRGWFSELAALSHTSGSRRRHLRLQ